ncbi:Qat anti-phage system QueC-like protein QatC [Cupriavidus metallidurans]|uniref:7-cyano-7-deazaguanine synthase n=1 Tax=Cupriavidus metallidurans (strain ATCC 43123 / DSM 2839 / NBRC 102507 / CH34) TaxID=266264 RepID=Q1LLD1_CUPMC|nr:Qat anti-phage system QueC-like protein QatC [Cupriavidus metallidurans]ABF09045.1 conserved hypothetical protein [Cupriavidus metallidurans CH34]QGS30064.1 hypothetical protein FOB83_14845 [Cupriavidus metallidurans]
MKVICTSFDARPRAISAGTRAFTFFQSSDVAGSERIANGWLQELERAGYAPSIPIWDFVLFGFAVCAADLAVPRNKSADGWTRELELSVTVVDPTPWNAQRPLVEGMLRILTGDFWSVTFLSDGPQPPRGQRRICDRDCVALLSGGLDSLIGGIDAVAKMRRPIFVSQLAYEDSERQRQYAAALGGAAWHQQWSHRIDPAAPREPSTRARSMGFYALAVLATSLLTTTGPAEILVPENGFISVNPPLLPGRMASLSTRTTHPLFMKQLQGLLKAVGIPANLSMPYRFKTKGEMMMECLDQKLLAHFASDSTSCGRYRTYNRTHCGRCVPCMVRRAAFLRWGQADDTRYKFPNLRLSEKSAADDPMAVACAVLATEANGIDAFLGATLSFATQNERVHYRDVAERALLELSTLLKQDGVL